MTEPGSPRRPLDHRRVPVRVNACMWSQVSVGGAVRQTRVSPRLPPVLAGVLVPRERGSVLGVAPIPGAPPSPACGTGEISMRSPMAWLGHGVKKNCGKESPLLANSGPRWGAGSWSRNGDRAWGFCLPQIVATSPYKIDTHYNLPPSLLPTAATRTVGKHGYSFIGEAQQIKSRPTGSAR